MIKKILIGLLIAIILISIGGYAYYRIVIYQVPKISKEDRAATFIMPLPAQLTYNNGYFKIESDFRIKFTNFYDDRLAKATHRFSEKLSTSTGVTFTGEEVSNSVLLINCKNTWSEPQQVREDESYELEVKKNGITLTANTPYGVLHGLETLLQLPEYELSGMTFPCVTITDAPRFPWRGLMLDVCRHWISKEAVLRQLDGMAANKMNVFHWHLTEYQAFRVESKVFPKLHELGANGNYYTQEDIKEIVAYAGDRGIRVVPEFDLPGHATSWFVGYPALATESRSYELDTKFGVLNPVMDPTKEEVYSFLDQFFGEMAELFPDEYFHIGGDEVRTHDWEKSPTIKAFMEKKEINDYIELQAYFNERVNRILKKHGKKMVGWDEILNPNLGNDIIVQSWRSHRSLFEALQQGGSAILSAGYYLDHKLSAEKHYSVDPEILPGAIDIEEDINNWQTWDISINFGDNEIDATMTLYGINDNIRGFFSIEGRGNTAFETATLVSNNLKFKFQSDYGEIEVNGEIDSELITGTMGLGMLKIPFTGKLIGSNNMVGTSPPKVERIKALTEDEKNSLLGGEACMWTEVADESNIDSRIWPRTAAIAEKFWSLAEHTTDATDDMYRRLNAMDGYLTDLGIPHQDNYAMQVELLALGGNGSAMKTLVDVLEEVKYYDRMSSYANLSTDTDLDGIAHTARPESILARHFNKKITLYLEGDNSHLEDIKNALEIWKNNDLELINKLEEITSEEIIKLSEQLTILSTTGLALINAIETNETIPADDYTIHQNNIERAKQPQGGAMIAVVNGIEQLLNAANTSITE